MENFLTFDLENWYDSEFIKEKKGKDFVVEGLDKVLALLDKHNTKATFFVTGDVLEKYPNKVKEIVQKRHEIASHSYEHKMLNKISKEDIKKNLIKSKNLIKKITGKYPMGFRAPSWSINKKLFWVFDLLDKLKFSYSSSLFPVNMGAYGSRDYPINEFYPVKGSNFLEMPPKPFSLVGIRIPFCGGVYFRIWPVSFVYYFIRKINSRGERAMIYLHPWEFCKDIPRVKTSLVGRTISYYGLHTTEKKLDYLLRKIKFNSIENILKERINKKKN